MNLSSEIWGVLPPELVREVLVTLAQTNLEKARELRFVSSDVNVLVLPIIFHNIVMVLPDHVTQITTTLLPKRKNYVPALRSRLHIIPRLLSTYRPHSWVLVVNDKRPSIETALSSIAPVFVGISKLAITGQNLSSNAFWLRRHAIHPKLMLLVHFGSPHLVNFHDPIFKSVTHLYTSVTHGHRQSSVADLPSLTHLAVSTRPGLPEQTARNIAKSLVEILQQSKTLTSLVAFMPMEHPAAESDHHRWESLLRAFIVDERLVILPYYRPPRLEWNDTLKGLPTLWDRADDVRRHKGDMQAQSAILRQQADDNRKGTDALPAFLDRRQEEWEIDLVQRHNYQSQVDDPDMRAGGFVSAHAFG